MSKYNSESCEESCSEESDTTAQNQETSEYEEDTFSDTTILADNSANETAASETDVNDENLDNYNKGVKFLEQKKYELINRLKMDNLDVGSLSSFVKRIGGGDVRIDYDELQEPQLQHTILQQSQQQNHYLNRQRCQLQQQPQSQQQNYQPQQQFQSQLHFQPQQYTKLEQQSQSEQQYHYQEQMRSGQPNEQVAQRRQQQEMPEQQKKQTRNTSVTTKPRTACTPYNPYPLHPDNSAYIVGKPRFNNNLKKMRVKFADESKRNSLNKSSTSCTFPVNSFPDRDQRHNRGFKKHLPLVITKRSPSAKVKNCDKLSEMDEPSLELRPDNSLPKQNKHVEMHNSEMDGDDEWIFAGTENLVKERLEKYDRDVTALRKILADKPSELKKYIYELDDELSYDLDMINKNYDDKVDKFLEDFIEQAEKINGIWKDDECDQLLDEIHDYLKTKMNTKIEKVTPELIGRIRNATHESNQLEFSSSKSAKVRRLLNLTKKISEMIVEDKNMNPMTIAPSTKYFNEF